MLNLQIRKRFQNRVVSYTTYHLCKIFQYNQKLDTEWNIEKVFQLNLAACPQSIISKCILALKKKKKRTQRTLKDDQRLRLDGSIFRRKESSHLEKKFPEFFVSNNLPSSSQPPPNYSESSDGKKCLKYEIQAGTISGKFTNLRQSKPSKLFTFFTFSN